MEYGDARWFVVLFLLVVAGSQDISSGVPHATTQDDIYEGYLIPKGSVLLPSTLRDSADAKLI